MYYNINVNILNDKLMTGRLKSLEVLPSDMHEI
jgi:hypothetical protein